MKTTNKLRGQTVIFTGTPKSNEAPELVRQHGGEVYSFPLIRVQPIHQPDDIEQMKSCKTATWLIFTSQSSVQSFAEKMERYQYEAKQFKGRIAAVGTKTAAALERLGFEVSFIPTVFSADVFVKQFAPEKEEQVHVVFLRGNLASSVLREGLPFRITEWTVYETVSNEAVFDDLVQCLQKTNRPIVSFASPSAVHIFAEHIAPQVGWEKIEPAAIGHVTERALAKEQVLNPIVPRVYTLIELVKEIVKTKGRERMTPSFKRNRRLRTTANLRAMVRETTLSKNDFIYPIFVIEGENIKNEIPSMPGIYQFSLDQYEAELTRVVEAGVPSIILFGVPSEKDACGTEAYNDEGIVQRATKLTKQLYPDLVVLADTCLCQYTDHGHCGVVEGDYVDNDKSLELLAKTAVSQARAGADIIAPSNMMDGFVAVIREALDEAGFVNVPIMSYAVKYASAYYGPFRDAADSAPQFGDRKTYQMDPANRREALREAESDIDEGADFLIVKPALSYLDIMREVKDMTNLPVVAYNVSGEYSMVKAAAAQGWIDEKAIVLETLLSMKRAGADLIMTYHAIDAACWLEEN